MKEMEDAQLIPVHGGVTQAWRRQGMPLECNAFCTNGLHCDVVWTAKDADPAAILLLVSAYWTPTIVHLEKASLEAVPPDQRQVFTVGDVESRDPAFQEAWLVFWKTP